MWETCNLRVKLVKLREKHESRIESSLRAAGWEGTQTAAWSPRPRRKRRSSATTWTESSQSPAGQEPSRAQVRPASPARTEPDGRRHLHRPHGPQLSCAAG